MVKYAFETLVNPVWGGLRALYLHLVAWVNAPVMMETVVIKRRE